ncbi:MAG: transporter substrate-binding protein, partial [Paenibacillus sp.]|nr:transporter substrate-binding protein [Paenibacillus sp.]
MKRSFLSMSLAGLLLTSTLTGCFGEGAKEPPKDAAKEPAKTETKTTPQPAATGGSTDYKQAPMLDGGSLPPVKDRLPADVKVTNEMPSDMLNYEVGTYGGTLRTVTSVVGWDADVFVMNNEPLLNTPGILGKEITGNVLLGYKASADQKEFEFKMRKGLKWSDGKPVTTEDVKFTVEDVLNNQELMPLFPAWLRSGGKAD